MFTEIDVCKLRLIDYLIEGKSISKSAELAGISRQTVYNWLKDPDIMNSLRTRFSEEEEKRQMVRDDHLKAAWSIVARAVRGDLLPEEKISLSAAQFTIRVLGKSNTSPEIERIIHAVDVFVQAEEDCGPVVDDNEENIPDKITPGVSHATTRF